jgi:GNAT superfamily N-acetyltransferase
MEHQKGQFRIVTDLERIDLETIVGWLIQTYWAKDRSREQIRDSWHASGVVACLYHESQPIGCARAVTDFVTLAYLADVLVLPEWRGQGLGRWLVETVVDHSGLARVKWMLHTRDAHELYRKLGFAEPGPRVMERQKTS